MNRRCKETWISHAIETNRSRVNSELIPEANRRGDPSATKSVEVHFNTFIRELEGYQSRHQYDSVSYLPIDSIDDSRDDSRAKASIRVALPAMPKLALLGRFLRSSSNECNRMRTIETTQAIIAHPSAPTIIVLWAERSCEESKRAHTSNQVHLRRLRADLCDTPDSHLAMPPMAVPIANTFYTTRWSPQHYWWC